MSDPVAASAAGRTPQGTLTLQTVPMPADTNSGGDVFGGWVVSQMDIAAGTTAMDRAQGRCATVAIEALRFHAPVLVAWEHWRFPSGFAAAEPPPMAKGAQAVI